MLSFYSVLYEKGRRKKDEDSIALQKVTSIKGELMMALLCDGCGGMEAGETASGYAAEEMSIWFYDEFVPLIAGGGRKKDVQRSVNRKVYDIHEKLNNWMRGNDQSFRRVEEAIAMLREEPLVIYDIVTCATERNIHELPALRQWLIDHGVETWRVIDVFPQGRAATDPQMLLTDEHYRQLLDFIRSSERECPTLSVNYGCEGFVGEYEFDVRPIAFHCHAGITVGGVMADGRIAACASIRSDYSQGSIYTDDFMDVWENRFQPYRDHSWMRQGACADCNMWRYCQGNGMHLRDAEGRLMQCHLERIVKA